MIFEERGELISFFFINFIWIIFNVVGGSGNDLLEY